MSLNISNVTNITGMGEVFVVANNVSYGAFGASLSITILILLIVGMWKGGRSMRKSMIAASLASFFIDLIMISVGMLNAFYAAIPLLVFALSLFGGDE